MTARLILTLIVGMGLATSATLAGAQGGPPPGGRGGWSGGPPSPEQRAKFEAQRKAMHLSILKKLHLSSSQMHKIKDFDEHQDRERRALMSKGGRPDRSVMEKMRDQQKHVYQKVMSAKQYKMYEEMTKAEREKMRGRMGGGRRGGGGPGGRPGAM